MSKFLDSRMTPEQAKKAKEQNIKKYKAKLTEGEMRWYESIPTKFNLLWMRARRSDISPRKAIEIQCMHCCGWSRKAASECDSHLCPLHQYRPGGEKWQK